MAKIVMVYETVEDLGEGKQYTMEFESYIDMDEYLEHNPNVIFIQSEEGGN